MRKSRFSEEQIVFVLRHRAGFGRPAGLAANFFVAGRR